MDTIESNCKYYGWYNRTAQHTVQQYHNNSSCKDKVVICSKLIYEKKSKWCKKYRIIGERRCIDINTLKYYTKKEVHNINKKFENIV